MSVQLFTIGFAETSADSFFSLLRRSGAKRVIDVRLNNTSQLSGFTRKDDLRFFLREVCGMDYLHLPQLAPTPDILDAFKKRQGSWSVYEQAFKQLINGQSNSGKRDDPGHRQLGLPPLQREATGTLPPPIGSRVLSREVV